MRNVFTAQTPAEAHLVAGVLTEAGIECVVEGELLTGVRWELPPDASTLPGVFVRDEDAARALALIAERHTAIATMEPPTLPDDEMPERRGLLWFKRLLLAGVISPIALLLLSAVEFVASLAGTPGLTSRVPSPVLLFVILGVSFAIACLVVPARRAPA